MHWFQLFLSFWLFDSKPSVCCKNISGASEVFPGLVGKGSVGRGGRVTRLHPCPSFRGRSVMTRVQSHQRNSPFSKQIMTFHDPRQLQPKPKASPPAVNSSKKSDSCMRPYCPAEVLQGEVRFGQTAPLLSEVDTMRVFTGRRKETKPALCPSDPAPVGCSVPTTGFTEEEVPPAQRTLETKTVAEFRAGRSGGDVPGLGPGTSNISAHVTFWKSLDHDKDSSYQEEYIHENTTFFFMSLSYQWMHQQWEQAIFFWTLH